MNRVLSFLAMTCVILLCSSTHAQPTLKFPFPGGETWKLTRTYNTQSHIDYGGQYTDDRYAIDIVGDGCSSLGKPVLAAAAGTVHLPKQIGEHAATARPGHY